MADANGTSSAIWRDGVQKVTGDTGTTSINPRIGNFLVTSYSAAENIGAVIITDALAAPLRRRIENSLALTWKIPSS